MVELSRAAARTEQRSEDSVETPIATPGYQWTIKSDLEVAASLAPGPVEKRVISELCATSNKIGQQLAEMMREIESVPLNWIKDQGRLRSAISHLQEEIVPVLVPYDDVGGRFQREVQELALKAVKQIKVPAFGTTFLSGAEAEVNQILTTWNPARTFVAEFVRLLKNKGTMYLSEFFSSDSYIEQRDKRDASVRRLVNFLTHGAEGLTPKPESKELPKLKQDEIESALRSMIVVSWKVAVAFGATIPWIINEIKDLEVRIPLVTAKSGIGKEGAVQSLVMEWLLAGYEEANPPIPLATLFPWVNDRSSPQGVAKIVERRLRETLNALQYGSRFTTFHFVD